MDDPTPPKRVTRARAAAKTGATTDAETQPEVKIALAAKTTRTKAAPATKRKTRADDDEASKDTNEEEMDQPPVKSKGKGRSKKSVKDLAAEAEKEMSEDELAVVVVSKKATRGRTATVERDEVPAPVPAPVKSTRGRAGTAEREEPVVLVVATKSTRGRIAPVAEEQPVPAKTTRGRAAVTERETTVVAPVALPKTRGRPKKIVETPAVAEATKTIRGRWKKTETMEEADSIEVALEPVKKTTRGRPIAATKLAPVPKKTVKFEEPHEEDKENFVPIVNIKGNGKEAVIETGLKAKPVRRAAATAATRATRGRAKVAETNKSPLSPKKATQVAKSESVSEDELATMEKTPMKPLMKSPMKAPGSIFGSAKKLDFRSSIVVNRAIVPDTQSLGASFIGSPARRPPQSPFRDSMKSSPKKLAVLGESILKPPFKMSMGPPKSRDSPFKVSLLQSPARRPQSPTKVSVMGSPSRGSPKLNSTPKPVPFSISRFGATPRTLTKSAYRPTKSLFGSAVKTKTENSEQPEQTQSESVKPFSGRLSSVMPRHADADLQEHAIPAVVPEGDESNSIVVQEQAPAFQPLVIEDDAMVLDEAEVPVVEETLEISRSKTPAQSPPRDSVGSFSLHRDEDPFQDSDSEDELASASPKYSPAPLSSYKISSKDFAAPSTPAPFVPMVKTPRTNMPVAVDPRSAAASKSVKSRRDQIGFTPLAQQLSGWLAASSESEQSASEEEDIISPTEPSFPESVQLEVVSIVETYPAKSTFFDDEMVVRDDIPSEEVEMIQESHQEMDLAEDVGFSPAALDDVDIALATEAEEMSLLDEEPIEDEVDMLEPPMERENEFLAEPNLDTDDHIVHEQASEADNEVLADAIPTENNNVAEVVDILNASILTRAVSEASQEYGDENAMPIDPALLALDVQTTQAVPDAPQLVFATPVKVFGEREVVVHTVSKVPLKEAAVDTPSRPSFDFSKKRPASVSRVTAQRQAPAPPVPATSVTSRTLPYNPNSTPAGSNGWSNTATPTRTPRRDIDSRVLKGAVVYVDVHTTEGADASAVFIELLGQMGARCIKSWGWKLGSASMSPEGSDTSSSEKDSKIGITHVVFKDGGKRILEKVRETKGVVCCVGVGWVLDCERTQSWLDEAPYTIDTSLVPRGGARRRKSMEPRQLFNQNGNLTPRGNRAVSTPRTMPAPHMNNASPNKDFLNTPGAPATVGHIRMDRRKSTIWERSPSSDDGNGEVDENRLILSPVPATPAPEAISMYAEHVLDGDSGEEQTPYFLRQEELVTKTAPANRVAEPVGGILGERREENGGNGGGILMQRLLLARRKSLQFAPKVGSPLARARSYHD